ncbi:hypothetical protein [Acutalibacter sp. 1XD8-36]|uniref:hypothetical protein n=1 Tax=Acutalibacter sp. 1XD8-36 TaxID=2320852 RepID=UPI0026145952|nr:hypothetical protein [Acutalibacter sp. 1XD8-36]
MSKANEQAVKDALLKRALGYEYEEKIIEARKDGSQKMRVVKKHVPPDPRAAERVFLLMKTGRW